MRGRNEPIIINEDHTKTTTFDWIPNWERVLWFRRKDGAVLCTNQRLLHTVPSSLPFPRMTVALPHSCIDWCARDVWQSRLHLYISGISNGGWRILYQLAGWMNEDGSVKGRVDKVGHYVYRSNDRRWGGWISCCWFVEFEEGRGPDRRRGWGPSI